MKFIICILFLITTVKIEAQSQLPLNKENKVSYSEVVKDSTKKKDELFSLAKDFLSTNLSNFQRSNSENNHSADIWGGQKANSEKVDILFKNENPITLSDKENNKIIAKVVNKYTGGTMGCIRILYFKYDIILKFKDGRYKYEISDFNYTHYNQASMQQSQLWGWDDSGDCNSKSKLENLLKCEKCKKEFEKLYSYLDKDTKKLITEMKKALAKDKKEEDDW